MKTFYIELITPEKVFFRGDVEMLVVDTVDGEMGILAGHIPSVSALHAGILRFKIGEEWKEAFVSEGFVEVRPDETIVLSQALEWPEDIISARAEAAIERAKRRLIKAKSQKEYIMSKASLARAFARLRVKSHYNNH